jgi:hypothetical protein
MRLLPNTVLFPSLWKEMCLPSANDQTILAPNVLPEDSPATDHISGHLTTLRD